MPKALFILLFLAVFSLASLWFVENDGSIIIDWMGYRVQTSVAFTILFLIITIVTCTLFLQVILWVKSAPKRIRRSRKERRLSRGLIALTQGFAAIAAGDLKQARSLTKRADSNLDNMPLTKLLAAQTAQLEGNKELASQNYNAMLEDKNKNKETEIIAIKGLLMEAREDNDLGKAMFLAEKAYKLKPDADWVILILVDLYKKTHKWKQAIEITKKALKYKLISKEKASHDSGLINYALYEQYSKSGQNKESENFIKEAYKLVPDSMAVIIGYSKMLGNKDKSKKEVQLLENYWKVAPHPDVAAAYMEIYASEPDNIRMEKAERLLELQPLVQEPHVNLAAIALEVGQFGKARAHLKSALSYGETKAVCLMMAELESLEKASHEVVHYWRERGILSNNFAVWQCGLCDYKPHSWHVNCPECNGFNSLEWKTTPVVVSHSNKLITAS